MVLADNVVADEHLGDKSLTFGIEKIKLNEFVG